MKSKRLLSFGLAVAMSLSALGVYATRPADTGVTVQAATIEYSKVTEKTIPELVATVEFKADDMNKLWKRDNKIQRCFFYDPDTNETAKNNKFLQYGDWYYYSDLAGNKIDQKDCVGDALISGTGKNSRIELSQIGLNDNKLKSVAYKVYGWTVVQVNNKSDILDDNNKSKIQCEVKSDAEGNKKAISKWVYFNWNGKVDKDFTLYFVPVYRKLSDDEIVDQQAAQAEAEAEAKANDSRYNHCWGRAYRNSAGNNAINKTSGAVASIAATAKLQTGSGTYSTATINAIKKAVGAEDDELVFVYDVTFDSNYNLIDGKQVMVRLYLPDKYVTTGYIPTVFHAPLTGVTKIDNEKLDVGTKDVMFFARDFSPYVLILSPGKVEKYENPPTGDAGAVPIALLAAASLSATGAVLLRRKRELGE